MPPPSLVRMAYSVELDYQVGNPGAHFVFNVQAAHTAQQRVVHEQVSVSPRLRVQGHTDAATGTRYLRLHAGPGALTLRCETEVELTHHVAAPHQLTERPVQDLPDSVLRYLSPSRYCESDRLAPLALSTFGHLRPGGERVLAVRDWVHRQIAFRPLVSTAMTSARDTLNDRAGVCRDFAHVMIALCRALSIPARFTTGFDYGADPSLGPPDFHAYVEAWLNDRWYLFDPSGTAIPMSFVRLATGRDASDAAFATLFGPVLACAPPRVHIEARPGPQGQVTLPWHTRDLLSTDDGRSAEHA